MADLEVLEQPVAIQVLSLEQLVEVGKTPAVAALGLLRLGLRALNLREVEGLRLDCRTVRSMVLVVTWTTSA